MCKELLTFFKASAADFESEVPYNYYGNRGSVDIVSHKSIDVFMGIHWILNIFEVETRIIRLEELIRKLKDRFEYFPKYYQEKRRLPRLGEVNIFLVLLNTETNWQVVNEYLLILSRHFPL